MTDPAFDPAALVSVLRAQEERLVLRRFTHEDAWRLGCLLADTARQRSAPVTIDIRRGHQQVFHCALPGTSPDNDDWIDRKRRVVERFSESSYLVGTRFRAKGTTFEASSPLDPCLYAAHGGSFPIRVEGAGVIGTVTVSGSAQAEDHAMVVEALETFLAPAVPPTPAPAPAPQEPGAPTAPPAVPPQGTPPPPAP
ncbi:heme-degrading domain-containing protein [Streptomyces sp. F63]|uniref:heme-degrading domain-containing protein n=1 Tax=Streptomyces sp. F63 TaxID=2824887 RepID=UPI001B36F790|nr:heme-degrading domain-containing protein [Streptomyces sp. F63]MBQ0983664.1 heme-degrading domain-containing protein [Streptomyces sp. F63]